MPNHFLYHEGARGNTLWKIRFFWSKFYMDCIAVFALGKVLDFELHLYLSESRKTPKEMLVA